MERLRGNTSGEAKTMKKVRFGVVGVGGMGGFHVNSILKDSGREFCLAAVADVVPEIARRVGEQAGVPHFGDAQKMYDSGLIDAVIIATPHYWHAPLAIRAARAGRHVLCEKPLSASVGAARAMLAECRKRRVTLGVMLQQRTRPTMVKMKQLVEAGAIGKVFRVQMICSNWFRTQAYYDSGSWRGTWDGEGGGVLINQAPHSLDLFQWIGGMPRRVKALVHTRAHRIEVEDTANVLCEYDKGKVGYIYATTAEEPGMEQLMLCGSLGTMIAEGNALRLGKLRASVDEHIMGAKKQNVLPSGNFTPQGVVWREVKVPKRPGGHIEVTRAFARHVLRGTPLVATGEEALNELELSNAAYLSGYGDRTVELPVDADAMERLLARLERQRSTGRGGGLRAKAGRELRALLRARA